MRCHGDLPTVTASGYPRPLELKTDAGGNAAELAKYRSTNASFIYSRFSRYFTLIIRSALCITEAATCAPANMRKI
jgi:hypothetical protein